MFRKILINVTLNNSHNPTIICNRSITYCNIVKIYNVRNKKYSNISNIYIKCHQRSFSNSMVSKSYLKNVFVVNASSPSIEGENQVTSNSSDLTHIVKESNPFLEDPAITYIPPPPVPPDALEIPLNALGEPTLWSLGLGGWSPIGLLQNAIEFFHVSLDIPWWGAIALTTLVLRLCLSPVVILSQRNAVKMSNTMPKVQEMNKKMSDARMTGDNLEAARLAYEMQQFMKKEGVNPLKSVAVPLLQAPVFISMFIGLRRCTNLPVESFQTGGMLWFTDLTVIDPYYLLPIITSLTLLATIEVGAEGRPMVGPHAALMKYVLRGLPVIMFPFIVNFPAGILCYWVCTNFFSLGQVALLKIPAVRQYFAIGEFLSTPTSKEANKGFKETLKSTWSNMKVASQVQDRHRVDEIRFKKAGTGPLVKTYRQNPLAVRSMPTLGSRSKADGPGIINVKAKPKN